MWEYSNHIYSKCNNTPTKSCTLFCKKINSHFTFSNCKFSVMFLKGHITTSLSNKLVSYDMMLCETQTHTHTVCL